MMNLLLHLGADGRSTALDMHVAVPAAIAIVFAVGAIWAPAMPRAFAGVRARAQLPQPTIVWPIVGAWALALTAQASGWGDELHHDGLIEGGVVLWAALVLFLVAWQVMIAAMMLPSSLPLIRLFNRTAANQPHANWVRASFIAGYAVIWTAFGAIAFAGDIALHELVGRWGWLNRHEYLIGGSALVLAGAFQFSALKDKCLDECRNPASFLLRYYRRGAREAFRFGRIHGQFCLGCCWALMLVAFAVGVANLAWMSALTLLMVYEKTGPGGDRGVAPIGIGFIALGALVLLNPSWLPSLFAPA